ncbi:hypothetical protein AQUCO_00300231v1 [Aquilegia coerulea]|uniref:Peptidase S59 domain-containing protein n=1 Tax=Aquilegia coerulea TaxID=218851 RepID=A0A2G5EXZ3_AQUCA|nr:hypothetical protein AQUCO_00300231v1 [Aquilegia coerulea]
MPVFENKSHEELRWEDYQMEVTLLPLGPQNSPFGLGSPCTHAFWSSMSKISRDYYTKPSIEELEAKEKAEPGFCRRVKDFVIGRHGYGSIKFIGYTDVLGLDLETHVCFNHGEVIVYIDNSKKPPVGQGLNKPAEVTLLNIMCLDKKTGQQYTEGPKVEKYKKLLVIKAREQGAESISYHPLTGEWKLRVEHFNVDRL